MSKQTAVEYLVNVIQSCIAPDYIPKEIIQQAKEIEKQQILDAWKNGYREFYDGSSTPEDYYNETFKSNKQSYQDKMRNKITKAKNTKR